MKIVVTQEILDLNPYLAQLGIPIGHEIKIPDNAVPLGDETPNTETLDEDPPTGGGTGGERPPVGPRRP